MAGFRQYFDGLQYLRKHIDIFVITLHKGINGLLVVGVFQVVQVTIAEQYYPIGDGGSISLGFIYVATGIGTGIGPILGRSWARDRHRHLRIAIAIGYVFSMAGFLITSTLISFPVVLFGAFLRGIGGGDVWVLGTQLLLQLLPNEVRGRVFSTEFAMNSLMTAIASGAAGIFIDSSLGVSGILILCAGLTVILTVLWTIWVAMEKREHLVIHDKPKIAP